MACAQVTDLFQGSWRGYDAGTYRTGRFAVATALGDIDGDGDIDAVVTNDDFFYHSFAVLKNRGDGTYGYPQMYAGLEASLGIALADVDADGDLDIIRSETKIYQDGTLISIHRNNGSGTFGFRETHAVAQGPAGISTGDFDGDGRVDIAVCNYGYVGNGHTVTVLYGDASAAYTRNVVLEVGGAPRAIRSADLNGDGRQDLAVARDDDFSTQTRLVVSLANSGGSFASPVVYDASPPENWASNTNACLAIGDLDRDSRPDIVFSSTRTYDGWDGGFLIFRNQGAGQFGPKQYQTFGVPYSAGATSVEIADLNGDGWKDIVAAQFSDVYTGGYYVLLRNASGGYPAATAYPAGRGPYSVNCADVNGDGKVDVLASNYYSYELTAHLNPGTGAFNTPPKYQAAYGHNWLDMVDVDGDGDRDALTSGGSTAILLNNGNGGFGAPTEYPGATGRPAGGGKLRDLDGDGIPDMLFADWNGPNGVTLYARYRQGLGNGLFGPLYQLNVGFDNPADIDAVDLNHDGLLDVVVASKYQDALKIGLNMGGSGFFNPITINVGAPPEKLVFGDFNRDGHVDVACPCYTPYGYDHRVTVVLGNGDGTFAAPSIYNVDDGPLSMTSGDFNGDGILDLATANTGYENDEEPSLSILIGNANGTFQAERRIVHSAVDQPSHIAAGDVDGDGRVDLLVANYSNDISFLKGRGDGNFDRHVRYGIGISPAEFRYVDVDGDGTRDVAAMCQRLLGGITDLAVLRGSPQRSIAGTVALQSYTGPVAGRQVVVELRTPGSTTAIERVTVTLDASGNYSFRTAVSPGTYDVTAKASHWLRLKRTGQVVGASGITGANFSLVNGDVNGDNSVSLADFAQLRAAFGSTPTDANWDANSDLNGDGAVTLGDFAILRAQFGATGDE